MLTPSEYLRRAQETEADARRVSLSSHRDALHEIARNWRELARQAVEAQAAPANEKRRQG